MEKTRINKYLSEVGYCSRRAADKLLEEGRIKINGKVPELGTKVSDEDLVEVDGKPVREPQEKPVYIVFNKPVGIVCTTDTKREKTISLTISTTRKGFSPSEDWINPVKALSCSQVTAISSIKS